MPFHVCQICHTEVDWWAPGAADQVILLPAVSSLVMLLPIEFGAFLGNFATQRSWSSRCWLERHGKRHPGSKDATYVNRRYLHVNFDDPRISDWLYFFHSHT